MHTQEKVADVDRGYPEDEENLHWPEDASGFDEDDDGLDDDEDLDALDENLNREEEEISWAIQQESGREDWE